MLKYSVPRSCTSFYKIGTELAITHSGLTADHAEDIEERVS